MSTYQSKPANSEALLDIGTQCSDPLCRLVDFLPFKCDHCKLPFCQEHFKVEAHKCPDYDEFKHNRVAPDCPFCQVPVALKPGEDPNVRLELHFEKECSALLGKVQNKSSSPVCARGNCRKVLFSPIKCDACRQVFCPAHRFPSDHTCKTANTVAASGSAPRRNATKTFDSPALPSFSGVGNTAKNINAKASEAVANVKKSVASAAASASASSSTAKPSGASANPFKATGRVVPPPTPAPPLTTVTNATPTIPNHHNGLPIWPSPILNLYSFIPRPIFPTN